MTDVLDVMRAVSLTLSGYVGLCVVFAWSVGHPIIGGPGWVWSLLALPHRAVTQCLETWSSALAEGLRIPVRKKTSRAALEARIAELERELEIGEPYSR